MLLKSLLICALFLMTASPALAQSWTAMLSPGALHPEHAAAEGNCDACHSTFAGIPNEKCLACHEPLRARIQAGIGYHSTLVGKPCIECHTDHGGPKSTQIKPAAIAAFQHSRTGFDLTGAHEGVQCETCHTKPIHELGALCGQCHEDTHASALGPSCESCHDVNAWDTGLFTLEQHALSMDGKHGEQSCTDCHTHGAHLKSEVACVECHDDVHGGTKAPCEQCHQVTGFKPASFNHGPCTCAFPGKHQTVGCLSCHEGFKFTDTPIVCSGCHTDERPHDDVGECSKCHTATSWANNRFDHNKQSSFRIEGAHQAVACAQCHTDGQFRTTSKACESCHTELGASAHGDFASYGGCSKCHTTDGFAPSTFDHGTATGFTLEGRHGKLPCQECHAEKVNGYVGPKPPAKVP